MKTGNIGQIEKKIREAKAVVIITHTDPDGDAIGSTLGLYHFFRDSGKKVHGLVPSGIPNYLTWMPGAEDLIVYDDDPARCGEVLGGADLVICADLNAPDRMEGLRSGFEKSNATSILIDHHTDRGRFCDLELHDPDVSSTSELVFGLIDIIGGRKAVTRPVAECLYVGIMTDTGSFSYACNHERTFLAVAALVAAGADAENIHRLVYDTYSEQRLRLLGFCLSERLRVMESFKTAFIALSKEDLQRYNFKYGDTEGVVNYTLGIKGIVFGAMITEREGKVKISLRSKGDFDVNKVAREQFNGGGHRNASGGELYSSFEEAVKTFISIVPQYARELNRSTG